MNDFEKLERNSSPELDEILGKPFPVLDKGFVRVVDYMGSDSSIVQAARVSYGKGTKKVSQDENLIRYLLRNRHTTPFEMCEIKLHVKVPMDAWRQWIRHRTANVNEYSTRYSLAIDDALETPENEWRFQAKDNKQGSEGELNLDLGKELSLEEKEFQKKAREIYESRIEKGVAREQARKDLPLCTYTEAYWKIDLHNLLHFLALRMDAHAQYEIRKFAETIGNEITSKWVPLTWKAFNDYRFNSLSLSHRDVEITKALSISREQAIEKAGSFGWLNKKDDGSLKRNRERSEFEIKAEKLGLNIPWK